MNAAARGCVDAHAAALVKATGGTQATIVRKENISHVIYNGNALAGSVASALSVGTKWHTNDSHAQNNAAEVWAIMMGRGKEG